uniref:Uncharacterized protein n=1 Tax=Trypanosoma congolense (strain IL3000) TaxID=1068625 RepID=G0UV56_TRYCI|nr:conserved hypothetical protein [Trypanosoma congolense IL3000]
MRAVWLRTRFLFPLQSARFYAAAKPVNAKSSFKASRDDSSGRNSEQQMQSANPYKSWEHMNHKWLILMCIGCLAGGSAAGHLTEVDETALKPPFQRSRVLADVAKTFEFRPDLAPTAIRVAFLLAARRAGLTADSFDESCAVARGLEDIAGVLQQLRSSYNISTEDAASLLAVGALKFLGAPCEQIETSWRWGRNDVNDAPPRKKLDGDGSLDGMPRMETLLNGVCDLTDAECVALMACHSVGEFHEHVSGLDGATHIGTRYKLDNAYYKFLFDNERRFFRIEVPRTEENKEITHLPKNFSCVYAVAGKRGKKKQCVINQRELNAILGNPGWRKLAEGYVTDSVAWSEAFQSAFTKMIDSNFRRLRPYSGV